MDASRFLPRPPMRARGATAFSLVELVVALSILVLFIAVAVAAMVQFNRQATTARLATLALATAQERIDQLMTVSWQTGSRPALLAAGTTTENSLPLNDDSFATAATFGSAFSALDSLVSASRTTTIADLKSRLLRATVTVSYTYRSRPYSYSMSVLRTTDNI